MSGKLALAQHFIESNPLSAARVLENTPPADATAILETVADAQSSSLLRAMLPQHAARCVSLLTIDTAATLLTGLEPRTIAEILRHVPKSRARAISEKLPRGTALRLSILLNYSLSMVGSWVDPAVLVLPDGSGIGAALDHLRREEDYDYHQIYVVGGDHVLRGYVRLNQLLQADPQGTLSDLLQPSRFALNASASLDVAIDHPGWEASDYLPVVDRHGKFLGGLRYATLRKAMSNPRIQSGDHDLPGTFMDLAETCYLGLAEVMNSTLAAEQSDRKDGGRSNG